MKKTLFLFLTLALAAVSVSSRAAERGVEPNQINVTSAQELLDNLGSDRILVITEGYINLTEALLDDANDHLHISYEEMETTDKSVFYYMETDGPELHIRGLKNLTILSGLDVVSIVIDPRYANVFTFENCENINLSGLTLGHTDGASECSGAVVQIDFSSEITLDGCRLYGCGTLGVDASMVMSLHLKDCEIYECSIGGVVLYGVSDAIFENCSIHDVPSPAISLYDTREVMWNNADVFGEHFDVTADGELAPVTLG